MMRQAARIVYLIAAGLFLVGVVGQVFLAGMVVVSGRMGWNNHVSLGHGLALPLLVMLVTVYLGRMPGTLKRLTWALFAVYVVQADVLIFLRASAPVLAAFHPVMALVDFALGALIVTRAWSLVRQPQPVEAASPELETTAAG